MASAAGPNNDVFWGPYARFCLARLRQSQGRAAEAGALQRELVAAWFAHSWKPEWRASPAPMRTDVGLDILLWSADALFERGDLDEAARLLDEAASVARPAQQTGLWAEALRQRGRLAERMGHPTDALALYQRGLDLIEGARQQALIGAPAQAVSVTSRPLYEAIVDLLLREPALRSGARRSAFEFAERSRARSLMEFLAQREVLRFPPDAERARRELARTQATLEEMGPRLARLDDTASAAERQRISGTITELSRREALQRQALYEALPVIRDLVAPRIATERDAALYVRGKRVALLVYYRAGTHWWLWVFLGPEGRLAATVQLTRTTEEFQQLRGQVERLRELVAGLIAHPVANAHAAECQKLFTAVGQAVLPPRVVDLLRGQRVDRLQIVWDSWVSSLSFAAFPASGTGKTLSLIQEFEISYALSVSLLRHRAAGPASVSHAETSALVLANPSPSDGTRVTDSVRRAVGNFAPLSYAAEEAAAVRQAFPAARVLTGAEATEANARRLLVSAWLVHFAAHAVADIAHPDRSAVLLAGNAGAGPLDDGALEYGEILQLDLPDTELVVLSGCETAAGRLLEGEGVQCLAQAFLHAGARSVIATQWRVFDDSTANLMRGFYARLGRGQAAAAALQQGQLALQRRHPDEPWIWAPFVLIGDPR